jgi:hypothetical protein
MRRNIGRRFGRNVFAGLGILALTGATAMAQSSQTYTTDADFDLGTLLNLNHNVPNSNQLQLNAAGVAGSFPFINVAASGRGTIVRINTVTGVIVGEYRMGPQTFGYNNSRTTVDLEGNVWCTSRNENRFLNYNGANRRSGSIVKIGLVIGGTRGRKDGAGNFIPDPTGEYLQGPFSYNTCVDRDGDGLIRTSRGLGNILNWTDVTDSQGGVSSGSPLLGPAMVQDADDECILVYQRLPDAENARSVSVDANNNVWAGGYPFQQRSFWHLKGTDGSSITSFNARTFGAGGYGGLIDGNGILWSASISQHRLLRYDPVTNTGFSIPITLSYGLGIDNNGFIWNTSWTSNRITKISPAGVIQPGFPKGTGSSGNRGVAVTSDNHIWTAASFSNVVTHMDNNGNVLSHIPVGNHPTGVAVDAAGKVWVTNFNSSNVMRIDPALNGGLGAVDLTVNLGAGATPYNYSDMTGIVALQSTARQGTWNVVHDGGCTGKEWGLISWNESTPAGTSVKVEARAADSQVALASMTYVTVSNGVDFSGSGVNGRFVEVRTTLKANSGITVSPILFDLTIDSSHEMAIDIWPNRTPNPIYLSRPYTIYVAVLGSATFDATTLNPATVRFGKTGSEVAGFGPFFFDINFDGKTDAFFGFPTIGSGIGLGDTQASVTATTFSGVCYEAADSIVVFP